MSNNIATVHQMFSSFGQADISGVIDCLADNVTIYNGSDPRLPFSGTFGGKNGALDYFQRLLGSHQITALVPTNFQEPEAGKVVHNVHEEGFIPETGKTYSLDLQFHWEFDAEGKVADWRATGDFSSLEAAYELEKETAMS